MHPSIMTGHGALDSIVPTMQPRGLTCLTPSQALAVSGGKAHVVFYKEEGQPIKLQEFYYRYLPTFPIKDLSEPAW